MKDESSCNRVITAIASQPWAIKPDALEMILGIARREFTDMDAVLSKKAERIEGGSVKVRDGVAIIPIMGPIFPRADLFSAISGATSVESLALQFGEALASEEVKAIVLHVDSPGGQVTGIHEFANQIYDARGVKPVAAYVSSMGCSAAYWIASAVDTIYADETAEVGSIGVVMAWEDDSEARKAKGLKDYEIVSSQSPNKRIDFTSKEGKSVLQQRVDALADIFIADVARNRGKQTATIQDKFGAGGTMFAAEAKKAGMIDHVNSLEGVIRELSGNGTTIQNISNYGGSGMPKGRILASEDNEEKKEEEVKKAASKKAEEDTTNDDVDEDEEDSAEEEEKEEQAKASASSNNIASKRAEEIIDLCTLAGADLPTARAYIKSGKSVESVRKALIDAKAAGFEQLPTSHTQRSNGASRESIVDLAKKRSEARAKRTRGGY